jgi:hypothetical protein
MSKQISLEEVENIFKTEIDLVTAECNVDFLGNYLEAGIRLYSDFSIEGVDDGFEKDFLSFGYGYYPSQHNPQKHAIISIIRHFNPNEFNGVFRYDYLLKLHFDNIKDPDINPLRIVSKDFEAPRLWQEAIEKTIIYNDFKMRQHTFFEVQLIKHKSGW